VSFANPNPVASTTNPNQKVRPNSKSDGGKEEWYYPNLDYQDSSHSPTDNRRLTPSSVRDDRKLPHGSRVDSSHSREFNSPQGLLTSDQDRAVDHHDLSCAQSDDEEGSEEEVQSLFLKKDIQSLFLKRDIPDATEDHSTHVTLTELWTLRQEASSKLVQALSDDDSDLFDTLEELMRKLNQRMHRVYKSYLKQNTSKSDDVPVVSLISEKSSPRQTSYEETDTGEIRIKLDYNGVQVVRQVKGMTQCRVVYHLAQEYLREVFALRVDNLSDLLLLHRHHEIPVVGIVDDIPILDGDEIMVMFRRWGDNDRTQRHPDLRFEEDKSDGGSSVGNHADYHREERHDLNHARAPSQPGTNGGAFASARDTDRHYRRERNELNVIMGNVIMGRITDYYMMSVHHTQSIRQLQVDRNRVMG
jgi:hypothetical protein